MSALLDWLGGVLLQAGKGALGSLAVLAAYRLLKRRSARVRRLSADVDRLGDQHPSFAAGTYVTVAVAVVADVVALLVLTDPLRELLLTVGLVAVAALLTLVAVALVRHARRLIG